MKSYIFIGALFLSTISLAQESGSVGSNDLRGRTHNISVNYKTSNTTADLEASGTTAKSDVNSGEMDITYAYNFGYIQPFVSLASEITENNETDDDSRGGSFELGARFNFIKNEPGNDIIPFAALGLGSINSESDDGTTDVSLSGRYTAFYVGLNWYPIGEIFAFSVAFSTATATVDGDVNGVSFDGDMKSSGITIGSVFSF